MLAIQGEKCIFVRGKQTFKPSFGGFSARSRIFNLSQFYFQALLFNFQSLKFLFCTFIFVYFLYEFCIYTGLRDFFLYKYSLRYLFIRFSRICLLGNPFVL